MKRYTYSQARQRLSEVLDTARQEEVLITRRSGEAFAVTFTKTATSPFDVPPVAAPVSTDDILSAIRESRRRKA